MAVEKGDRLRQAHRYSGLGASATRVSVPRGLLEVLVRQAESLPVRRAEGVLVRQAEGTPNESAEGTSRTVGQKYLLLSLTP